MEGEAAFVSHFNTAALPMTPCHPPKSSCQGGWDGPGACDAFLGLSFPLVLLLDGLKSVPWVIRFSFDALGGFYPSGRTSQVLTQMLLQTLPSISSIISALFCKPFSSPPWLADRVLLMGSNSGTLPSQRVADTSVITRCSGRAVMGPAVNCGNANTP